MNRTTCVSSAVLALMAVSAPTALTGQERSVLELLEVGDRMVRPGTTLVGEISESDYVFQNGERVQAWGLAVSEPGTWRVDLTSSDFDTYLRVLGPGLGLGEVDDDGGEGLNSSLCLQLSPGNYRLVASGLFGNMGRYAMQVLPASDGESCGSVGGISGVEMDPEDMTPQGTLQVGGSAQGILTEAVTFLEEPAQTWLLPGNAGQPVRVILDSDAFDTYLYLDGPGLELGANYDDDSGCGLGARIEVTLPETGTYLIVATSFFGSVGEYTISVLGPDDPDPACDDGGDSGDMGPSMFDRVDVSGTSSAGAIAPGESRLGSLSTLSAQVGGANADVWTLSARAGELLAITLAGDFDPKVFLVSDLLEDDYSDDDGGEGLDSRLCTQIPATGDYDVIVRGFSSTAAGSYTLGVERNPDPGSCTQIWRTAAQESEAQADFASRLGDDVRGLLSIGQTVGGRVGPASPTEPVSGRPIDAWSLPLVAGQEVTLDERASFDTYLTVVGPDGEEWFNDDGPCGLNSRITFTATQTGDYLVLASSLSRRDQEEAYELSVSENAPGCSDGVFAQQPVGSLRLNQDQNGALSDASYQTPRGSPGDVWSLTLANRGRLVIDQVADFDTYLLVIGPDGEELTNDDGACGLNSRIAIENAAPGEYLVVASALSSVLDGTEPYTLSVSETERDCSDLPDVPAGGIGNIPSISAAGGSSFAEVSTGGRSAPLGVEVRGVLNANDLRMSNDRLGQGWAIELQAGQEVVIELDSGPFDPFLHVVSPDGSRNWSDDDGGEGTNSRVTLTAETSGTYKIIVSAYTGTGDFSLRSWRVLR